MMDPKMASSPFNFLLREFAWLEKVSREGLLAILMLGGAQLLACFGEDFTVQNFDYFVNLPCWLNPFSQNVQ